MGGSDDGAQRNETGSCNVERRIDTFLLHDVSNGKEEAVIKKRNKKIKEDSYLKAMITTHQTATNMKHAEYHENRYKKIWGKMKIQGGH